MKRILLVTNIFPPMIGGPATFIDLLGHELSRAGWAVTVVCSSQKRLESSDSERPFRVIRVSFANRYWYEFVIRLRLFVQLLRHRNVFVNGLEAYLLDANCLIRRRYTLKIVGDSAWERVRNLGDVVLDIDQFQIDAAAQLKWSHLILKRNKVVNRARMVLCPSRYLESMVHGWGIAKNKIKMIANGIEDELLERTMPPRRSNQRHLRVLFVGRLTNWKGVETLLLAVRDLPTVQVQIAGDGPEYPLLRTLAKQLGLERRVDFLGKVERRLVSTLLTSSDVLVLTSLYEGMSHTLLEAMAHGVPCIASSRGGNPEVVIDGRNGLLIPAEDPACLAQALQCLCEKEEFRFGLAQAAYEDSHRFKLKDSVCEVIREVEADA